jgi:hypothetical protein
MSKVFRVSSASPFFVVVLLAAALCVLGSGCRGKKPLNPPIVSLALDREPAYYEPGEIAYATIVVTNPNDAPMSVTNLTPESVSLYAADADTAEPMPKPRFTGADAAPSGTTEIPARGRLDANWSISGLPVERGNYALYVMYRDTAGEEGTRLASSPQVNFVIE